MSSLPRAGTLTAIATLSTVLGGCAAPDLRAIEVASHRSAKPCCADLGALPPAKPFTDDVEFTLGVDSPHFDFGSGLAPFAVFRIEPGTTALALMSKPQGAQPYLYADLQPVFFDAAGRRLPPVPMSAPIVRTHGGMGWYALTRYVEVPPQAVRVALGTAPSTAGQAGRTLGEVPGGGILLRGGFIPLAGGQRPFDFVQSIYGSGWLLRVQPTAK